MHLKKIEQREPMRPWKRRLLACVILCAIGGSSSCGPSVIGRTHLTPVPARPVTPPVEFVSPQNPDAIMCLDEKGIDAMLFGEEAMQVHIKKLEAIIKECR